MADALTIETEEAAPATGVAQEFVEFFAGAELSAEDADAVTLRWPAQLVVFAGAEASGKTTLLASIYERLCQGPLAGFKFAGSRSLLGFEQICHLNRLVSGGARPDTPRTASREKAAYYHLALKGAEDSNRQHVLFSAVSGELYRLARNSTEDCKRLTYLQRADAIVVLVDGASLAVRERRTNAQADASGILASFLDAKMLGESCQVGFVFSKLDRVIAAGDSAIDVLNRTQKKLESQFSDRIPNLTFKQIAARPDSGVEVPDGLEDAFSSWIRPMSRATIDTWPQSAPPNDAREFSKFGWRYFEQTKRTKS